MLEAEWWQVCGEVWVQGQRKMSQLLDAFGPLLGMHFEIHEPFISLIFQIFGGLQ